MHQDYYITFCCNDITAELLYERVNWNLYRNFNALFADLAIGWNSIWYFFTVLNWSEISISICIFGLSLLLVSFFQRRMHDYVEKRRRRHEMWKSANHFLRLPQCIIGRDIWWKKSLQTRWLSATLRCVLCWRVVHMWILCDGVAKPRQCFWI